MGTRIADSYDAFLIDLDGVLWRGADPVPGASDAVNELRATGKRVVFITNNAIRTTKDMVVGLHRLLLPSTGADIVTSADAVIELMKRNGVEAPGPVHVLGSAGLQSTLHNAGFRPSDDDPVAVVVGGAPDATFAQVRAAADLVRAGVPFFATNTDAVYPHGDALLPGAGAVVAAVSTAGGKRALVAGKPGPLVFEMALARAGVEASRALVVGDSAATDVSGGREAGCDTALVLTGVTQETDLGGLFFPPEEILDSLADLTRNLPRDDSAVQVTASTRNGVTHVSKVDLGKSDRAGAWIEARRKLVQATATASEVTCEASTKWACDRIGIDAEVAGKLF